MKEYDEDIGDGWKMCGRCRSNWDTEMDETCSVCKLVDSTVDREG